ncbi:MAG: hypothetical protein K1X64_10785 [Myxococcaceae bacterium]|nr:hypothetical protein [Myxococcaceae bacterium]
MIICPVCENPQASGPECTVCGKDLQSLAGPARPPAPSAPVAPLPDLEATFAAPLGEVPVQRVGELEASRYEHVEVPNQPIAQLDALPANPDVPVERLAELTVDRVPEDPHKTVLPAARSCRYCGTPLGAAAVCNRCGMSAGLAPLPKPADGKKAAAPWVRCRACGAPGYALEPCKECGRFVPLPEL